MNTNLIQFKFNSQNEVNVTTHHVVLVTSHPIMELLQTSHPPLTAIRTCTIFEYHCMLYISNMTSVSNILMSHYNDTQLWFFVLIFD